VRFLRLDMTQIRDWRERTTPLGMSRIQYDGFLRGLTDALRLDNVPLTDCDVRLKGSSVEFFSGAHKVLPTTRIELIDLFGELRRRLPDPWEVSETLDRLTRQWLTDGRFPKRRPFDSIYRLAVADEPSDYDLQLSSDRVVNRCKEALVTLGVPPDEFRLNNPTYNFVNKRVAEAVLPNVLRFTFHMYDALRRQVSVAVFPSSGPPDVSEHSPELSSHFRETDWKLTLVDPDAGVEAA
jgi:hypothetical protein